MLNRKWVIYCFFPLPGRCLIPLIKQKVSDMTFLFQVMSLIAWPIDGQCHCLFLNLSTLSHYNMTNSLWVTQLHCRLIPCYPTPNSMWVMLCQGMLIHLILWPIVGEWHCSFFHLAVLWLLPHCIPYQQSVSVPQYLLLAVSYLIPQPTVCEWHCHFFLPGSLMMSCSMTHRKLVILHFSHCHIDAQWQIGSEWNWVFIWKQFITPHLISKRVSQVFCQNTFIASHDMFHRM